MKRNEKPFFAAWQQLPSPQVTAAMAQLGFSWLVVDLEHASITIQEAEAIFIACEAYQVKPFARLPSAQPYLARRLLDAGASGLIIPVVEDKASFEAFAKHCFFPPKGKRGLGLVRANAWGGELENYFNNFAPLLIAQIETKKGAENINSILQSIFLDGIMIGPYDLSASLGKPGNFNDDFFKQTCQSILSQTIQAKKLVGFHQLKPDLNSLKKRIEEKYDFIAYGTDLVAIKEALDNPFLSA